MSESDLIILLKINSYLIKMGLSHKASSFIKNNPRKINTGIRKLNNFIIL
jgi:hypothetical protein